MSAKELLESYSNNLYGIDRLSAEKAELKANVLTPEQVQELEDIEAEYTEKLDRLVKANLELAGQIKAEVIAEGQTVRGSCHMAVYSPAKTTWDSKGLERYAKDHPEIKLLAITGNPSVSIRIISGKGK